MARSLTAGTKTARATSVFVNGRRPMASGKGELDCCPDGKGQIANDKGNDVKIF